MSNEGSNWELYDYYLSRHGCSERKQTIRSASDSFNALAASNPAYQANAKVNGVKTPLLASKENAKVCKIHPFPTDNICIGDLVQVYGGYWIVVEMYRDELGLPTGVMWLCNHHLKFQNFDSTEHETWAVIDDGSYSNLNQKAITVAEAHYTMYVPLNDDTNKFYIDKRFAIDTMYNTNGEEIMQVMKITWIDKSTENFGAGSHLLALRLAFDVYNKEKDNISKMICDYISDSNEPVIDDTNNNDNEEISEGNEELNNDFTYFIDGRNNLRIGTTRSFNLLKYDSNGDRVEEDDTVYSWSISNDKCTINASTTLCKLTIPLDGDLVGEKITLSVYDENQIHELCHKVIEVVSIG